MALRQGRHTKLSRGSEDAGGHDDKSRPLCCRVFISPSLMSDSHPASREPCGGSWELSVRSLMSVRGMVRDVFPT